MQASLSNCLRASFKQVKEEEDSWIQRLNRALDVCLSVSYYGPGYGQQYKKIRLFLKINHSGKIQGKNCIVLILSSWRRFSEKVGMLSGFAFACTYTKLLMYHHIRFRLVYKLFFLFHFLFGIPKTQHISYIFSKYLNRMSQTGKFHKLY